MAFDNDEVDYKQLREARAAEREETRDLENSFKLNIGNNSDKLLAILEGRYKPPTIPGEPERITRNVDTPEFMARLGRSGSGTRSQAPRQQPRNRSHDGYVTEDGGIPNENSLVPEPQQQRYASSNKYAEVTAALDKFDFSQDAERKKWQMSVIAGSIRTAIQTLVLDEVASNTKTNFKGHVDSIVKTPGGLRTYFSFSSTKVNVIAKGTFYGDEIIAVFQKDGHIYPRVMRDDGHGKTDVSSQYELVIAKTKESNE